MHTWSCSKYLTFIAYATVAFYATGISYLAGKNQVNIATGYRTSYPFCRRLSIKRLERLEEKAERETISHNRLLEALTYKATRIPFCLPVFSFRCNQSTEQRCTCEGDSTVATILYVCCGSYESQKKLIRVLVWIPDRSRYILNTTTGQNDTLFRIKVRFSILMRTHLRNYELCEVVKVSYSSSNYFVRLLLLNLIKSWCESPIRSRCK